VPRPTLFKIGRRASKLKPFGYGINYQNMPIEYMDQVYTPLVIAVDKAHRELLPKIKNQNVTAIVHDPTELKSEMIDFLVQCKEVITIRSTVKKFLKEEHGIPSTHKPHPFYEYTREPEKEKTKVISLSRIDFDKNIDILVKANKQLETPIKIYGALNRIYHYHKLKPMGFDDYYLGNYPKEFKAISNLHSDAKFMVDLSTIKNDGGGTQYTFLEAIYENTALILNSKWVENGGDFVDGENCFAVSNETELVNLINSNPDTETIVRNAKKLLPRHTGANWH
jgi:glycosyltransferase involved in cell wall biosynthesis